MMIQLRHWKKYKTVLQARSIIVIKQIFKIKKSLICTFLLAGAVFLWAKSTPIENLYSYELKNGLELFVAENHTVPLVYIEIAVRGGGIGQTKENAGLFHLYEHMMFKGNSKYKSEQEMQAALTELGVSNWNGATSTEYVNYFFTIPSSKLKTGLEFWNAAIRNPLLDEREFENEKRVVLSEIEGDRADPSHKLADFLTEKEFPEEPWVRSPGGTPEVVSNATLDQLRQIQKEYYIPNNAALFVGGDVNPEEVYKMVKQIYGSWKKGNDPWTTNKKHYTQKPLEKAEYYVMPDDRVAPQMANVIVIYRGPDAEYDREDTYAADVLVNAAKDPAGFFKQSLARNKNYAIPDQNYVSFSYPTSRRLGLISVSAVMMAPNQYLSERVIDFTEEIPEVLSGVLPVDSPLTEGVIESVHNKLYNDYFYEQETASSILGTARFWWCCADTDYYYTYTENLKKTSAQQVQDFVEKYMVNAEPLVLVLVNPEIYELTKAEYEANGYGVIQ